MSSSRLLARHGSNVRSAKRTSSIIKQKRTIFFLLHNHKRRCHHPLETPQWRSSLQKDTPGSKEKEKEATQPSWPGPKDFRQSMSDTKIPHFHPWKTMRGWRSDLLAHLPEKEQNAFKACLKDIDRRSTMKDKPSQNDSTHHPYIFDQYAQQRNSWRQQHDLLHEHLGAWRETKARIIRGLRNELGAQRENISNVLKQQMEYQMGWEELKKPIQPSKPPACTLDSSPKKVDDEYEIDLITLKRVKKSPAADTARSMPASNSNSLADVKVQSKEMGSVRPFAVSDIAEAMDKSQSILTNQTAEVKDVTPDMSTRQKETKKDEPLFASSFLEKDKSAVRPEMTPVIDVPMANEKVFDIYSPKSAFMHKNLQSLTPNENEMTQASKYAGTIANRSQYPSWDTFNNPAKSSTKAEEREQNGRDVSSFRRRLESFKAELETLSLSRMKEETPTKQITKDDNKHTDLSEILTTLGDNVVKSSANTSSATNIEYRIPEAIKIMPLTTEGTSQTETVKSEAGQPQTAPITKHLQGSSHTSLDDVISFEAHSRADHVPNKALDELITQTLLADKSWSDHVPESAENVVENIEKQDHTVKHDALLRDVVEEQSPTAKQTKNVVGKDTTLKSAVVTRTASDVHPPRSRHERRRILRTLQRLETQELNEEERAVLSNTIRIFMETPKQVQSIAEKTLEVKEGQDSQPVLIATNNIQDPIPPLKETTQTTSKATENTSSYIPSPASLIAGIQYDKKARGTLPDEEAVSVEIMRYLQDSKARQDAAAATNILEAAKAEQSKQKSNNQGKWRATKRILLTGTYVAACGYVVGVGSKLLFG